MDRKAGEKGGLLMVLVIDNYDSFTYNIVQYLGEMGVQIEVWRNEEFKLADVELINPKAIILSPGPGHPEDAGLTCDVIRVYGEKIPIMGVCLGHQAIGLVEGAVVGEAHEQLHGKVSEICLNENALFQGLPESINVVRYHSLVIDKTTCPEQLQVLSTDSRGEIMAVKHRDNPTYGVQFHPESYSTVGGKQILKNFIDIAQEHYEQRVENNYEN